MTTAHGLTARAWNGITISRRIVDGYVNATAMCKAGGKRWNHYAANDRTQSYIAALTVDLRSAGNPANPIHLITAGPNHLRGTWVHPRLAVDLARWIAPAFAVWMDGWFLEELTGQRQAPPQPAEHPEWGWFDQATRPQRHGRVLVDCLEQIRLEPGNGLCRRRIRHHAQRILDFFPEQSLRDQLAPVSALLREAAYRLDQVEEPVIR